MTNILSPHQPSFHSATLGIIRRREEITDHDPLPDTLPDTLERDIEIINAKQTIDYILSNCPLRPRERQMLELRFGLVDGCGRTLEDIGGNYGATRERVRQIEARILQKIKLFLDNEQTSTFNNTPHSSLPKEEQ